MTILADDLVLQLAFAKAWLSAEQVNSVQELVEARRAISPRAVNLGDLLVTEKLLSAWQVAHLQAEELGLPTVELAARSMPDDLRTLVPRALAERHRLVPFARNGHSLQVAVSDPYAMDGADNLRHLLGLDVIVYVAPAEDIARASIRLYGGATGPMVASSGPRLAARDAATGGVTAAVPDAPDTIPDREADAPVIKLVHAIIQEAIRRRASDIHLEPLADRFRVRYRIDGELLEGQSPPKRLQPAIISRVKIMANISIAEKRVPQDGRIQFPLGSRSLDLRVSTLPSVHGESAVMRILDQGNLRLRLPELGLLADDAARFERLILEPDGLILVTGPTGSGKTTTLYSCLQHLNKPDRKIITVEDPVEYQLSGVNQVPVRHETAMTFSSALRAMLRQSPNTVLVGEIRDLETAEVAINASLTGHMVLSTLHTNDTTSATVRLADIGVKPFLLSASLRAVLAQRLVRKVCQQCCQPCTPTAAERGLLNLTPAQVAAAKFVRGAGCPECAGTGYHGRTGIFELFVLNEELRQLIHEMPGAARLRARARALGLRTLREDGICKAIAGLTTIEEVVSITVGDAS